MGFVSSASSVYLDVQLTNYGRGVVLSGDLKTRISKFSLSDTDIDYRLPTNTGHTAVSQAGFIPDVSGNHVDCASGINDGFKCSSYLHQTVTPIDRGEEDVQVVVGIDKDLTGQKTYYSNVEVEVYMHDYYALCKLLSHIYAEDHKLLYENLGGGGSSTYTQFNDTFLTSFSSTSSISSGTWSKQNIKSALEMIDTKHRGQFVDFWDCVNVNYPNLGLVEEKISITSSDQIYMNNAAAVTGRLSLRSTIGVGNNYETIQKTTHSGLQTLKGNTVGVSTSPFTVAFSSGEKTTKQGAGPAGIGFTTTEFGYLVLGGGVNWGTNSGYKYYPSAFPDYSVDYNYDTTKYFLGFVHPVEFENAPELTAQVPTGLGSPVTVKGYDEQDLQAKNTYGVVKTVLPTLKYAITRPPITPNTNTEEEEQINQVSNLYEQAYDNSNSSASKKYSNFYYPIKGNRADNIKELIKTNLPTIPEYHQSTFTDHTMDTFSLLGTNLEYTNVTVGTNMIGVEGNTVPSVEKLYTINAEDVKNGKHYYNWFGRMMIEGDKFFKAIADNYNNGNNTYPTHVSQYSARTGTQGSAEEIDDFNVKIPMEFKLYSEENPKALPATCKVTIVYNKRAAKQSIGYSGFSDFASGDPHVPYWRVYDRTIPVGASAYSDRKPRFYGENGETINAYTSDPTDVTTAGNATTGKRIFRKVVAGGTVI